MKTKLTTCIFTLLLALGLVSTPVDAKTILQDYLNEMGIDVEVEVSAAIDYYDKYVWRGFTLDKDQVIQPSFTISAAGFEGGFWGSWDVEGNDSLASDEVDGWLGYNFDLGFIDESLEMVGMSVGHTWYHFPDADLYSNEVYVSVSLDTFLSPYFNWFHDYEDEAQGGGDGNYYAVGIGHSFTLNEDYGITLDLGLEEGFNNDAFIVGDGGYTNITAGLTVPLTDKVTMAPVIGFVSPWGDLDDGGGNDQNDEFYGGVSVSFAM